MEKKYRHITLSDRTLIQTQLQQGLSPEQIAGTMSRMNEPIRLCHETIYQAIYVMPKGTLRTETIALLRFDHNKR